VIKMIYINIYSYTYIHIYSDQHDIYLIYIYIYIYIYIQTFKLVFAVREVAVIAISYTCAYALIDDLHIYTHTRTHTHTYIHIYLYTNQIGIAVGELADHEDIISNSYLQTATHCDTMQHTKTL